MRQPGARGAPWRRPGTSPRPDSDAPGGPSEFKSDASLARIGRFQWFAWAFVPAFLLLHGIVAICLPSRFDPLSTIFIVLAELSAFAACLKASRSAGDGTAIFWFLLATAALVHSMAMTCDAIDEITQTNLLSHVPAIPIFLSLLAGLPLLAAVSIQNDRRVLLSARVVCALLSIATGALIYFEIFGFLNINGSGSRSNEIVITRLFDAIDFFLAIVGTLRWFGTSHDQERRFFRILATFLWMNAILCATHNRVLIRHDYVWLDLMLAVPYATLVPLTLIGHRQKGKSPSPELARAVRSGSPVLQAGVLIVAGFIAARSHFVIGLTAALFAIVAYGALNIFLHSGSLETEDSLIASNAALEKLAELDGLTGVPNRRAFNEALLREFAAASRTGLPLSLMMIDVDRFKDLNDTLGHLAGDDYLIQIAEELHRKLPRATDLVARYGGEEFAAILPATDEAGAMVAAEKARSAIAELGLEYPASAAGFVTVSVGASTYNGSGLCTSADLLESADRALYTAKRNGRNRSEFHRTDDPQQIGIPAVS